MHEQVEKAFRFVGLLFRASKVVNQYNAGSVRVSLVGISKMACVNPMDTLPGKLIARRTFPNHLIYQYINSYLSSSLRYRIWGSL